MSAENPTTLLEARHVSAGYSGRLIVRSASIALQEGEIVALIGHNGSGKSTLLKSIFGVIPLAAGDIEARGVRIMRPSPRRMLEAGVAYVPQGQQIFDDLTVEENLALAASLLVAPPRRKKAVDDALSMFGELPGLRGRLCRKLSGGERQRVALAACLVSSPKVLLLDEPTLGLSPQASSQLLHHLANLNRIAGLTMLIVEQRIRTILSMSHRAYVMNNGEIVHDGDPNSAATMVLKSLHPAAKG